jgi:hypothetical protein
VKRISRTVAGWLAGVTPSGHQRKMSFALKSTPNAGLDQTLSLGCVPFLRTDEPESATRSQA